MNNPPPPTNDYAKVEPTPTLLKSNGICAATLHMFLICFSLCLTKNTTPLFYALLLYLTILFSFLYCLFQWRENGIRFKHLHIYMIIFVSIEIFYVLLMV